MDSPHDESNASFLSDVLDFVSRELNHFVAGATGAPVATEPVTQTRHATRSKRPSQLQRVKPVPSSSSTPDLSHAHSRRCNVSTAKHLDQNLAPSRRHLMTMPGALLPRSPTSEPQEVPGHEKAVSRPANDVGPGVQECDGSKAVEPSSKAVNNIEADVQPTETASLTGTVTWIGNQTQHPGVDKPEIVMDGGDYSAVLPRTSPRKSVCNKAIRLDEERMRDKERIRLLEEEVKRLREQLLSKRDNMSFLLPPPPPPPPPIPLARIKINLDHVTSDSDPASLIASARASLKRAPAPVEAPINPPLSTKRQGLPTVGIPPDKMAAFLNEMKSVRLRKIAGPSNRANSAVDDSSTSSDSSLSFSNSSILSHSLTDKSSLSSVHHQAPVSTIGLKRKREWFDDGSRRPIRDRQEPTELWIGTDPKNTGKSSNGASSRSWLSFSTVDTTTPSLISDNDQDISPEDLPATPPQSHAKYPEGVRELVEVIDVDDFVKQTFASGDVNKDPVIEALSARSSGKSNLFSKRVPLSPLPSDTPRKPQPPSRLRRSPRHKIAVGVPSPGVQSLSQESRLNQPQRLSGRSRLHQQREDKDRWSSALTAEPEPSGQRTLDEELRRAVASLKSVGENISSDPDECDVFLGTGTRDKSSFSSLLVSERGTDSQRLPAR